MHSCSFSAETLCGSLPSTETNLAKSTWPRARLSENCRHRRGGSHFGFGLVVGHAEAVLGAQLVVGLAHGAVVGEGEAGLQGVDGRAPVGAPLQRVAEHGEGARLLRIVLGALVGDVGGAGSVHRQVVALAVLVRVGRDGEQRAGKADPGVGIASVGDDGAGEVARGGARVARNARSPSRRRSAALLPDSFQFDLRYVS